MFTFPRVDPEFKAIIPPLLAEEREQLESNLLTSRKCRDAIILWDGVIIDGHNRFELCMKHGIEFKIEEMPFSSREEARLWIIENQLGRRNLTDAARIELALIKEEMLKERAKQNLSSVGGDRKSPYPKSSKLPDEPIYVLDAIAEAAKVGRGTLHRYQQIKESGNRELLERVKSGELKIGTAHSLLGREINKKLRHADKMLEFIAEHVFVGDGAEGKDSDAEVRRNITVELNELSQQLQVLLAKWKEYQPNEHSA